MKWKPLLEIDDSLQFKPLLFKADFFKETFQDDFIYGIYYKDELTLNDETGDLLKLVENGEYVINEIEFDFNKIEYLDIEFLKTI